MLKSMNEEEKKKALNKVIEYFKKIWQAIKEAILKAIEQFKSALEHGLNH